MSTSPARQTLHPMLWVAAASVTAVSLAGVAKLTGLLPAASAPEQGQAAVIATAPATPASVTPPPKLAVEEAPQAAIIEKPQDATQPTEAEPRAKPAHKPAPLKEHHKPVAKAPAVTASNPPPADAIPAPPHTPAPSQSAHRLTDAPAPPPVCRDCGVIESVEAIQQKGEGSGIGAVGGAILGGVLGNQVGEGSGKKLARIGGAVLGGFAGNEAERRARTVSHYQVTVRMEDGTRRVISEQNSPVWRSGDPVRVRSGEIVAR